MIWPGIWTMMNSDEAYKTCLADLLHQCTLAKQTFTVQTLRIQFQCLFRMLNSAETGLPESCHWQWPSYHDNSTEKNLRIVNGMCLVQLAKAICKGDLCLTFDRWTGHCWACWASTFIICCLIYFLALSQVVFNISCILFKSLGIGHIKYGPSYTRYKIMFINKMYVVLEIN